MTARAAAARHASRIPAVRTPLVSLCGYPINAVISYRRMGGAQMEVENHFTTPPGLKRPCACGPSCDGTGSPQRKRPSFGSRHLGFLMMPMLTNA